MGLSHARVGFTHAPEFIITLEPLLKARLLTEKEAALTWMHRSGMATSGTDRDDEDAAQHRQCQILGWWQNGAFMPEHSHMRFRPPYHAAKLAPAVSVHQLQAKAGG